ncbi:hypothetical protein ACNKF0_21075 [Nocardioides sp. T5]|uniref:hypothetical protein n=1 Tax=Nocardioides sp. T5 TaxID=3400182 RepID=UPI003A83B210
MLLAKSWAADDLSIEDVPLVDELRYAIGDVPQRSDDERDLDETGLLEGGVDLQEPDHDLRAGVRPRRPGLVGAHAPHRGRRLRPRPHRRGAGPHPDAVADGRSPRSHREPGRSSAIPPSRPGPTPPRPPPRAPRRWRAGAHEFHLSTNYRNSAEIYAFAADYARRVGLDADLPDAVRRTGEEPQVVGPVDDLEAAVRQAVTTVADRVEGTVGIVVPVARRSEVNAWLASWPELADAAPNARAAVDSRVTPSGEDRVVVLTGLDTKGLEFDGIVVVSPQEIEDESATGRATLYVVLTRATQLLTTVG